MAYYYHGVASWGWFYPFHYTPLASDLRGLHKYAITFTLGQPFRPLQQVCSSKPLLVKMLIVTVTGRFTRCIRQLLAWLISRHDDAIKLSYYWCMLIQNDGIIWTIFLQFYPSQFPIDMERKKYSWEGLPIIPFIDEQRLLAAIPPDSKLTAVWYLWGVFSNSCY